MIGSRPVSRVLAALGRPVITTLGWIGSLAILLGQTLGWIARGLFQPHVRLGHRAICSQLVRVGVQALGVVGIVAVCIGIILALQMAPALEPYGQTEQVANFVGLAVFRALGPLMCAIILTGFAGAAIAAELGTMVVGEEVEAMETHALNPVRFLVVPRMIATTIGVLGLTIYANLVAVGAGLVVGMTVLDIPAPIYVQNTILQLELADLFTGLAKAGVFGLLIGAIACERDLSVTGGAAGVGNATTQTVVYSLLGIIIADLAFTSIFYVLGWH